MPTPIQASAAALDEAIAHLKVSLRTYIEAVAVVHAAYKRDHPGKSHHRFDNSTDVVRELLISDPLIAVVVGRVVGRGCRSLAEFHAPDA